MHIIHKWENWSEPFDVEIASLYHENQKGIRTKQRRTCIKCGYIQERIIN